MYPDCNVGPTTTLLPSLPTWVVAVHGSQKGFKTKIPRNWCQVPRENLVHIFQIAVFGSARLHFSLTLRTGGTGTSLIPYTRP